MAYPMSNTEAGRTNVGAVWWRVSTDDQREISPETQIKLIRSGVVEIVQAD